MTNFTVTKDGKMDGYLTTAEFAKRCGVSVVTVRLWIRIGKIKAVKVGNQSFIDDRTPYPKRKKHGQPVETWRPPIVIDMTVKYYYRVGITRKDIPDSPVFEIAGFKDKNLAVRYADNIVRKRKDWDDRAMQVTITAVALPPMTDEEDTLATKIGMLSRLTRE